MQEIFLGVGLFTGVVFTLASLVLIARSFLLPGGNVTITINEERELSVPLGGRLLAALAGNELFLPAACGGVGSCGQLNSHRCHQIGNLVDQRLRMRRRR